MPPHHAAQRRVDPDVPIALDRVWRSALQLDLEPRGTVRCVGPAMWRSPEARDAACLADVDPTLKSWSCLPLVLEHGAELHVPDLAFTPFEGRSHLVDVVGEGLPPLPYWVPAEAERLGHGHRILVAEDLRGHRLDNARELLRYARWRVTLNDRIRLLAALEQEGPLPVRACMSVLGTRDAIAVVAALALRRHVDLELDERPIGPETRVRAGFGG